MDCSLPGSFVHGTLQQGYWREIPFPALGDLLHPEVEPTSLASLAMVGGFLTSSTTWEAHILSDSESIALTS